MSATTILITGGYGCIGSETAKWLLRNTDSHVVIGSRDVDNDRTQRVFEDVDRSRMTVVRVDLGDPRALERVLADHSVTHVVHMAALQTPECDANRDLGLQVNLAGTQNLIEAMKTKRLGLQRFVFASSIAVYGPRAAYPQDRVPMLAEPQPVNVYGTWKLAGEHLSRLFHQDTSVPTISVRPGVLFGPGRDAGLTSTPTTAIKAVALGLPYQIPFASRQDYQYAPDVGAAIGNATVEPFEGYGVFTLPGRTLKTVQIVQALREAAVALGILDPFQITVGEDTVPFICDLEYESFCRAFANVPHTPLDQAIRQSLQVYRQQVNRGWLTEASVPGASR